MVNIWPLLTAQPVPILQSAWWLILAAWGIHTAVTGLFVWLLKRSIDKRDKRREAELPGVFNVAWKTRLSGALESNAGFKGLFRKAMTLVFVLVAHRPPGSPGMSAVYRPVVLGHAGTLKDPIPWVYEMDCKKGKYYSYKGKIYLCTGDMSPCVWEPGGGAPQWEEVT